VKTRPNKWVENLRVRKLGNPKTDFPDSLQGGGHVEDLSIDVNITKNLLNYVYIYRGEYIFGDLNIFRFIMFVLMFVVSIIFFIVTLM
jgi:hypothetical protein